MVINAQRLLDYIYIYILFANCRIEVVTGRKIRKCGAQITEECVWWRINWNYIASGVVA
jgi:hypothetical protein